MATRSRIGIYDSTTNTVDSIYCHFDGYPSGNGKALLDFYSTQDAVNELISYGDMSHLGDNVLECKFYIRDCYEVDCWSIKTTEEGFYEKREEYNYLFKDSKWYVNKELLTEEMCQDD